MGVHTTTTGRVKIGLALNPHAYELLKGMASGPRTVGALLDELIYAEASRRGGHAPERIPGAMPAAEEAGREPAERERAERQLQRQSERLRILHEIDRAILAARSREEIAEAAAAGVLRITDAARVNVALWQPEGDTLEVLATAGPTNPLIQPGTRLAIRPWPWFLAARAGRVAFEEDLAQQPDLLPEAKAALEQGIRSQVVIPLMVGGRPIGHLALARRSPGRPPDEDVALAQQVADSLAVAMHNARLLAAEQQARQRLETLQAANAALTRSLDLDAVLEGLLDYLAELIPYDSANVMLVTDKETVAVRAARGYGRWTDTAATRGITFTIPTNPAMHAVFSRQQSLLVPDTTRYAGWQRVTGAEHVLSWLAVPLVAGGRILGIFSVDKAEAGFFRPEHVRLAEALAPQAAAAIQNARLFAEVSTGREQLQALSRRLVELQEQERRALSRDLHDTSGQSITALKLGLGALKREGDCSDANRARIDELLQLADTVSEDLHRLAVNLRPSSLDRYGLVPALEQLLTEFRKKAGVQVEFLAQGMAGERLPADVETALYRIVQEAMTNCARYAQATWVSIMLQNDGEDVQVVVEDDGRGFDVDEALRRGRLGLLGMRERAEMLGGTLEIESSPGHPEGTPGTTIFASIPVRQASDVPQAPAGAWPALPAASAEGSVPEPDARLAEAAELARAKALSDVLVEITAGMTGQDNARDLLAFVLARSAEAIGCDYAIVGLREGDQWLISDGYHLRQSLIGERLTDADLAIAAKIERTGEVVANDMGPAGSLEAPARARDILSGAGIPLVAGGKFLGVVAYAHNSAAVTFQPSEVAFLQRLASLVTLAMENIHLREVETRQHDELAQRVGELETLLAMLPVGVAIAYDSAARVIRANPANAQLLGVPRQANVSLNTGELPREVDYRVYQGGRELRPEELPMQQAARGRTVRDMVLEVLRGDGISVTLLSSAVPLLDSEGQPRGAVGTFVDITAQRRALVEAEEARRMLEALMTYIPEGITIADAPDARILYVSRYGQELLGGTHQDQTAGEVAERWTVFEADGVTPVPENELPLVRAARYGEAIRDRELVQINAQGRQLALLCNAGPIRDREGKVTGGIVAWRDIEEIRRLNHDLQRRAAEQQAILDAIADGLVLYDRDGRIVKLNAVAEELLGYGPETRGATIVERAAEVVLPRKPDGSPFLPHEYPAARALRGEVVRNQEMVLRVPARPGRDLHVSVSSAPLRAQDGTVTGCVTTFTSTEAHHEANARLAQAAERLSQRETALRQANAELEAILAAITDGLIVYDAAGKTTRVNERARQMLRWSAETWQRPVSERAVNHVQFFHPDGRPLPRAEYVALRAMRGEVVRSEEYHLRLPDHPEDDLWCVFSAGPILGPDGRVAGAVVTWEDTAKLHEAHGQLAQALAAVAQREAALQQAYVQLQAQAAELRESAGRLEQRVQERTADLVAANRQLSEAQTVALQREAALEYQAMLLTNVRDAIIGMDANLYLNAWGGAAEELYGWQAAEVIGRHLSQVTRAQMSAEERAAMMRTLAESGRWRGEAVHLRRDGTPFWVEGNVMALRDASGAITGYVTVNRDVTQRKRAEETVARQMDQLREQAALLDLTHDAIYVHDLADATIRYWNRGAEERYGWTAAEAVGQRSHALTRTIFPQPIEAIYDQVTQHGSWEGELIHTRRDGSQITVASRWALKRNRAGQPQAVLEINNDITQYKQSEAQREAALRALEASRAQLQALSRRLVQMQERERSYVADQLYNQAGQVLAALKLQLRLWEKEQPEQSPAEQLAEMKGTLDQAMRDLHGLATQLHPVGLDRSELLVVLQQYLVAFGREHNLAVRVTVQAAEGLRLRPELATAIYRTMQEALANVAEHARASEVTLTISRTDDALTISLADNGIGFDLQGATAGRNGAVGLIAMRERVESAGGRLAVKSRPGSGTNVIIEVPMA